MNLPVAIRAKQVAFLGLFLDVCPGSTGQNVATEPTFLVFGVTVMDIKHLRMVNPFTAFALATQMSDKLAFDIGPTLILVFVFSNAFQTS